jgi:CRISPR-associated endonuclease/helicase Cas3
MKTTLGEERFFQTFFNFLTAKEPFEWQKDVFRLFVKGEIPPTIDIPTGCGKTALMEIWVSALTWQALNGKVSLPRRLVWIVNRRTVVDQATETAERIKSKLESLKETNKETHEALKNLSLTGESRGLIAVSTLRGELADNEEWKKDPTRPSIIVGTVDMIGSKLLFRGYGDGEWHRPLHAGLLGVDSIIVHDESHLTPAFTKLLANLLKLRSKFSFPKRFFVINLSATARDGGSIRLPLEEDPSSELRRRIFAEKSLYLHESPKKVEKMCELALKHEGSGARVLVYITSPEEAAEIWDKIGKRVGQNRVELLTGEMRGYERDRLVRERPLYQEFKMGAERKVRETLYLVSTAAGEVGINLDADHCVCDLAPADHLIQRLGRVNRDGRGRARVDLIFTDRDIDTEKNPLGAANAKTLEYLKGLSKEDGSVDVSPINLRRNPPPASTFSPEPPAPCLTADIVDLWSLTSIPLADLDPEGEREVGLWLHGKEEEPQTRVVWREDVKWLTGSVDREKIKEILQMWYRPITREVLTVRTERLKDFLGKVAESEKIRGEYKKALLMREDEVEVCSLAELTEEELASATLFLPCEIGGLSGAGTLSIDQIGEAVRDVADGTVPFPEGRGSDWAERRRRYYARYEEDRKVWEIRELGTGGVEERKDLDEFLEEMRVENLCPNKVVLSKNESTGEETEVLIYLGVSREEDYAAGKDVPLEKHRIDVREKIEGIVMKLDLPEEIAGALREAAEIHDVGKDDDRWQEAIGNLSRKGGILAKSKRRRFDWRACRGYRHELGSVARASDKTSSLPLHLEAATHGHGRPSFRDSVLEEMTEHVHRQVERFAEMQKRFGWWELAYLEALLKCADALASEEEQAT